jgi:hypothetical protein
MRGYPDLLLIFEFIHNNSAPDGRKIGNCQAINYTAAKLRPKYPL